MTTVDEPSRKILFVDDDPLVRSALVRAARLWGFVPEVAASAEEATALLQAWSYEVIVTDIHMPGVGGWVLLERLAQLAPKAACLVLTGDSSVPPELSALPQVRGVLHKPLSLEVLEKELSRLMGEEAPVTSAPGRGPVRPKTILRALLVEDCPSDTILLSAALRTAGVCREVRAAESIREAEELVRTESFDVVLCDLHLPDSDGIDTVRSLQQILPHTPIVVVSGNDDEELAEQAIEAGAQDYLVKGELAKALVGRVVRHAVERKKIETRLFQLATRDQLTGVVNRMFFRERVAAALARAQESGRSFAILSIDLDGFQRVNDSVGQDAGDALIHAVAQRLVESVGDVEVVARLGGDEFAVLLEGGESRPADLERAERCRRSLSDPFELAVGYVSVTPNVGAAFYPEAGTSVDALLSAADAAMARTKHDELSEVFVFSPELHAETVEKYRIEQRLRSALAEGEFHLVFQPQVAATDLSRIIGAEVLLRWTPKDDKPVSPGLFIPLLERSGQIVEVGRWVLREALVWRQKILDAGARLPRLSVNISARQLERPMFAEEVRRLVEEFRIAPGELELEITEATLVRQASVAQRTIEELRARGVRFSLDDFGTGYSSMNYLKHLPVDTLKVDQSFVRQLPDDAKSLVLARAIFELGRGLGLEVVAEGVETEAQCELVRQLGTDLIQGYLTGRPAAPEALLAALLEASPLKSEAG